MMEMEKEQIGLQGTRVGLFGASNLKRTNQKDLPLSLTLSQLVFKGTPVALLLQTVRKSIFSFRWNGSGGLAAQTHFE